MAKKKSSTKSKKSKPVPVVRHLRYDLDGNDGPGAGTNTHYLSLARDLSAINRRLYREGRVYHIKRITVRSKNTANSPVGTHVSFSVVNPGWVGRNAWKRGFEYWKKQRSEVMETSGAKAGKWDDFKVYMNDSHRLLQEAADGLGIPYLRPVDVDGNAINIGEWNRATLSSPDGTAGADQFELHMLGNHNGGAGSRVSVGLVKSYGESRTTITNEQPNTPSTASSDPLVNLFDDGTTHDNVMDLIEDENDSAPYAQFAYVGDDTNAPSPLTMAEVVLDNGNAVVGGFEVLCGLLRVDISAVDATDDDVSVLVELAPGNFRGIKAEVI